MSTKKPTLNASVVLAVTLLLFVFQSVSANMFPQLRTNLEKQLPDGLWDAEDIKRMGSGGMLLFQRKGKQIIGEYGDHSGSVCYKGELQENVIVVEKAVRMESDYQTGDPKSFSDLREFEKESHSFERFYPSTYAKRFPPYPNPGRYSLVDREQRRLTGCIKYFDGSLEK